MITNDRFLACRKKDDRRRQKITTMESVFTTMKSVS